MALIYVAISFVFMLPSSLSITKNERVELRETVKDMFRHAYDSYMTYAYPADELMPLNCKGRYRGTEPSRGDVDDILGNFSMTLIDSLDSLVIFGELEKFEEAVRLVIDDVDFDNDIVVSTFETNIRVLGGLLGGHVAADVLKNQGKAMYWYNDELLDMAKDIGERLLPAFNTTTGIPYPKVNLRYGVLDPRSRTGSESATCTACAGTMIMEFGALSRLTGDPKFETVAHKAMKALWTFRSRSSNLVGTVINIHNGEWVRRDSGVGAGIDSYYEYCLKAYILLGEEDYLQRFNEHYKAVMRYINRDSLFLNVHMNNPSKRSVSYMDSLQAFWPGLQVLKGDLKSAIELHELFYSVAKRHTFLPEAFTTTFDVHWGQHFLRPELVESTYFLYEATKDPYYLEVGKYIIENLNRYTRVPCGFAAVKDVRTFSHENRMDSFLLSETLKYLYLLFTDKEDIPINLHDFVFTTEAHVLPLALSNWNGSSNQKSVYESDHPHDRSCPSTFRDGSMLSFAERVRRKSRQEYTGGSCSKRIHRQPFANSQSTSSVLRAEQFIPGNKDHLQMLKAMGISVTHTDDGKVQLMQDASSADNPEMAAEGVTFMQSMIELAKYRSNDAVYLPRVVQILSSPYDGHIVLNASPAQFGLDLSKSGMGVSAEVVQADPYKGCSELRNKDAADHRIVIMERGECMFVDKVRVAESHGAVGAIIIDNNEGSSSETQPMFAMSGDGNSNDIKIPAVFLFSNEGDVLLKAIQIVKINSAENLRVRLGEKALKQDANTDQTAQASHRGKAAGQKGENVELPETTEEHSEQIGPPAKRPAISPRLANVQQEVSKLVSLMKNVASQPGFEFLTDTMQCNIKGSDLMKNIDDGERERWLYDALMESWRESKLLQGNADQKGDDFLDLEVRMLPPTLNGIISNALRAKQDCPARGTTKDFLNVVRREESTDSGVVLIGHVLNDRLGTVRVNSMAVTEDENKDVVRNSGREKANSDTDGISDQTNVDANNGGKVYDTPVGHDKSSHTANSDNVLEVDWNSDQAYSNKGTSNSQKYIEKDEEHSSDDVELRGEGRPLEAASQDFIGYVQGDGNEEEKREMRGRLSVKKNDAFSERKSQNIDVEQVGQDHLSDQYGEFRSGEMEYFSEGNEGTYDESITKLNGKDNVITRKDQTIKFKEANREDYEEKMEERNFFNDDTAIEHLGNIEHFHEEEEPLSKDHVREKDKVVGDLEAPKDMSSPDEI